MKIALSLVVALFLVGCGDDKKAEVQNTQPKTEVTTEVKTTEVKSTQEKIAVAVEAVAEEVAVAVEATKEEVAVVADEVTKEAKVAAVTAVKEVSKVVTKVTEVTKEAVEVASKEVEAIAKAPSVDAKAIYNACAGCHGADGSKAALGKSKIIKGWSADKVESALNGYKDGTYGGAMKAVMKGQAAKLSADETKAVSDYISTL